MIDPTLTKSRLLQAKTIVESCIGKNGLWADTGRYRHQCWTRDFVIAGLDALLDIGRGDVGMTHLRTLAFKQKPNGKIPVLYLDDDLSWLWGKLRSVLKRRKMGFMLPHYLSHSFSIENFSPWTKDSEILYSLGVIRYFQDARSPDEGTFFRSARRALSYAESHVVKNGLATGVDWRDTMTGLEDKTLLTNNIFLYAVYSGLGETEKARALHQRINREFFNGTHHLDYPGSDRIDLLGQSLAVLYGIASPEQYQGIVSAMKRLETGFTFSINNCRPNPLNEQEREAVEKTNQYGVIWPFINGFAILALLRMGQQDLALDQFHRWNSLDGFYEWYNPKTGQGQGGKQQLWSAALYLRAARSLQAQGLIRTG